MDRLHELEVFVAVADAGSFAKAGTGLRLSPPAVTRAISALEERLGARVFNRSALRHVQRGQTPGRVVDEHDQGRREIASSECRVGLSRLSDKSHRVRKIVSQMLDEPKPSEKLTLPREWWAACASLEIILAKTRQTPPIEPWARALRLRLKS